MFDCKVYALCLLSGLFFIQAYGQGSDSAYKNAQITAVPFSIKDTSRIPLKLSNVKDSTSYTKKLLKQLALKGTVSIGYDYGVLPFIAGGNFPTGGLKTEGNVRLNICKLPIEATFFYSSYKNILGLNNYFRISFDAEQFKQQMLRKLPGKDKLLKQQLSGFQAQRQRLLQQIAYIEHIKSLQKSFQFPNTEDYQQIAQDSINGVSFGFQDSLNGQQHQLKDSLIRINPEISQSDFQQYSPEYYQHLKDSLFANAYGISSLDSLYGLYDVYKTKYDSLNRKITGTERKIKELEQLQKDPLNMNPYNSKLEQFLGGIKKFEIGLCYPSYSTFLVQNMPVKGINVEYGRKDKFIAFTYGTTVNNLLFVPSNIQGTLQNVRSLYNYFDFNNFESGRKIIALKTGIGEKASSHLFIGGLIGIGKTAYNGGTEVYNLSAVTRENNLVLELDAKKIFNKNISVDVVAGRSAVRDGNLTYNAVQENINVIFSDFRSNAVLARGNINVPKTKTLFTFTSRWIDPLFRSFGTGFLRSDNFRFDLRADQYFSSKIKLTFGFKREEDNLLRLYDYTNSLYAFNTSLSIKLNRRLNVRASYYPIIRNLTSSGTVFQTKNNISNFILTYVPKCKLGNIQANLIYNYYLVSTDSQQIDFQNIAFINQYQFKNGFRFQLSSSWFKNNLADSLNNNTVLSVADLGYTFKNSSTISIGGKMASRSGQEVQFGFIARSAIRIFRKYTIETSVEKIMPGDFYNGFNMDQIKKFPYYCSSRFIITF